MSPQAKRFFQIWIGNTFGVLVAAHLVPGIEYDNLAGLIIAALLLGVLNAFVRPILLLLALPLVLLTLGLFMLVINGVMLYWVGALIKTFHVSGFWPAFFGALIVSLVSLAFGAFFPVPGQQTQWRVRTWRTTRRPSKPPPDDDDGGPIIDV